MTSLQSVGTVEVVDDDGLVVATLQRGDVHVLDPAPRTVVRVVVGGVVAALRVEASAPARPTAARDADGGAGRTVSPWSLHALRFPAPENEWMVVAVLAVLADESGSPFRTLREDASAWLRVPVSAGRLTGRLDKALAALGLEAKGDKIPVIARRVRESGILAAEAWHEVRAELARRRTLDGGGA
ncbi:hypothetical protein [Sanguibacter massiliensis]|uniref:hypothetical protein n=1 Tax=Sanguibacter massiliensis TaxID=1973217 RepID=UPI00101AD05B|nr:hypothetical protein [Sanguibacter massiliensis]